MRREIAFASQGVQCRGWLYVPDHLQAGQKAPAIVMANAISAVKEITLPGYAERFCAAGFAVLVFDYRNYGASDGVPRNHFVPHEQQQDVRNGITWLRAQPEVDANRVGGWGISLGGVHMLYLGAYDRRLKAVVSVATGLNALEPMMGRTGLQGFLGYLNADRDRRFQTGEIATYIPAVSLPGQGGVMALAEAYEFYTDAMKTYAPNYDNRMTLESVEYLLADRSAAAVPLIAPTALLMIHGEKDLVPPDMVREVFAGAGEPKKLIILDCLHTDLYVREPWLAQSADAAIAWFNRYLHNLPPKPVTPQQIERNKRIIRYFYEQANQGNLAIYDELFAPEFVSYSSAAGQELRGTEAFKQANIMYMQAFPDFQTTIDLMVAEGNRVVVYGPASGTNTGNFLGHAPTGKKANWSGVAIYRFNDEGKIDGRWQEFDGLSLFTQLGIIPPLSGAISLILPKVNIATDGSLDYEDIGTGTSLILLHGRFGTPRTEFPRLLPWLSQTYHVCAPSLRGYGESQPPPRDFPLDFYHRDARDVLAFMDALGIQRAHLLGFSDGGETALVAAGLAPERFKSVAVWGAVGYFGPEIRPIVQANYPATWMDEATKKLHHISDPDPMVLQWVQALKHMIDKGGDVSISLAPKITAPVLLMLGDRDRLNPEAYGQKFVDQTPAGRLAMFPTGHAIHDEDEANFQRVVGDFLRQADAQAAR